MNHIAHCSYQIQPVKHKQCLRTVGKTHRYSVTLPDSDSCQCFCTLPDSLYKVLKCTFHSQKIVCIKIGSAFSRSFHHFKHGNVRIVQVKRQILVACKPRSLNIRLHFITLYPIHILFCRSFCSSLYE
ncbi:MAG: hypothetical protein BWX78_01752 [Firmicutes bacterium ADurb.Bin099]|nr:MAG: hypothetical protein BWX78_01752 [Firmicutes bacterium ADurb.Bin099]